MTLDVRSAAILLECARRGSLGRAAAALNMTQPAITRTLKALEESYGVLLFERTTRGVLPTVYGEALLPYAKLIVSEAGNADEIIRQMRGASRGVVRVGGVSSVMSGVIVAAIAQTRRRHPDVQFQVIEELEDRLLEALKSGEIDIAVSPEPYADDEITLAGKETLTDHVHVYARPEHPLAGHRPAASQIAADQPPSDRPVSDRAPTVQPLGRKSPKDHLSARLPPVLLAEAARHDWALPPAGTPIVREWLRRFHAAAIEPRPPVIASRSVGVIRAAVQAEDLLCWMPEPLMRADIRAGTLVRIPVATLDWQRAFRIYRRRKGLMPPSAAMLVQAIGELAGEGRETGD